MSSFLKPGQEKRLREIGNKVDEWKEIVKKCGGNEKLAEVLADLRIGGDGKPPVEGSSLRVAAQKHANRQK